ncbi:hypothetical protein SCP_0402480 [Sparassis crispa]|uniref:F-box domain-containing protein n=1 Tax=Sparassis crispa TaxID=139825 RepID=A0A401GI40_9APHY|nr:hypothetical protein SCP_0402480 [Sparassis crispa]GBE81874.1 hypothetical protein SCP_0402480 [Sparassis crispa]
MRTTTDLPPEIVEAIAEWIDCSDDTLSFALASKFTASILSPRHTQLRHIRCDVNAMCLWRAFSHDQSLARNVRSLEIMSSSPCRVPRFICTCDRPCAHDVSRREAELELIVAVKNLANLVSFKWRSAANVVIAHMEPDRQDVWTSLACCRNLGNVDIAENNWLNQAPTGSEAAILNLSDLTTLRYTGLFADSRPIDATVLGVMLRERCPRLQKLILSLPCRPPVRSRDAGESILSGRWPDLRTLGLTGAACSPATAITFFVAHPQLSQLSIDELIGCDPQYHGRLLPLDCPPGLLPNLRKLESIAERAIELLSAPSAQPRPIEHVSIWRGPHVEDFPALLAALPSVTSVELQVATVDLVARIAQAAPWLTRLRVPSGTAILSDLHFDKKKKKWQAAISRFRCLEAFESQNPECNMLDVMRSDL